MFLFIFTAMTVFGNLTKNFYAAAVCLAFGLAACGDDATSANDPSGEAIGPSEPGNSVAVTSSASNGNSATSTDPTSSTAAKSSNSSTPSPVSSSSKKTETATSEEQLNEPAGVVNGSCAPSSDVIQKGEMATWSFYRESGDVFDAIMSPFIWNFPELNKTVSGNGMNSVNVTYEESGIYTAKLNVDGADVECGTLQVQGVPIVVKSCSAAKSTVNAGETISWTVEAESESQITDYVWTSEQGTVSGSTTTASMTASPEMHKKSVSVSVSITNADKTVQNYSCESVTVIDPNQVDVVMAHSMADSSKAFPGGETLVAQYPPNAVNCGLVCGAAGNGVLLNIDGVEYTIDYSLNITPEGCVDGKAAGTKISVNASMNVLCYVTY